MHCEGCGEKAEKHHENYDEPLVVKWLCRECHLEHHAQEVGGCFPSVIFEKE